MISKQTEGVYSRTQAFNFLKDLLGVPRKSFINKKFFNLFFNKDGKFYFIKKPEDFIKNLFDKQGIREFNNFYYKKKKLGKKDEAKKIADNLMRVVRESLAA